MIQAEETVARNTTGLFTYARLKQIRDILLDLCFPPSCVHCGRVDIGFCAVCQAELQAYPLDIITHTIEGNIVVASTNLHTGVLQSAVQALKYYNQRDIALILGQRLALAFQRLNWTIDMIVPVPLHISRLQERGYNQSQEMAMVLSENIYCPCEPEAITRTRVTRSQVGLNREERLQNLNEAFKAHTHIVHGKTLLLVDDVQTTGTTLAMCAEAARQAGATTIYGLTVTAASRN